MKQLISVLVAALFAAASVTAMAQDKKAEADKSAAQVDKKDGKKAKASKKASKKSSKKAGAAKTDEMKK